jgi:hypothetical protein
VYEQERLRTTYSAQRVVSSGKESSANPATGVCGMDEEQEHLAILCMNSRVAEHAVRAFDGDQQHVWR